MAKDSSKEVDSLFSPQEKRHIVRNFVDAYLRGVVRIMHFGDPDKPDSVKSRVIFLDQIRAVCETGKTAESVQRSIDYLFSFIMASRLGNRIEGEFLEAPVSLETRVVELENKFESEIKTLSKILSLVLQWIRNYQPVLDEAVKDYTDKLGRIKNLDKKD
jgi:hypothetical protein